MQAAVLIGLRTVEVKDVQDPVMPEGGILIEVATCAICGTDVKMYRHGYSTVELPLIPGHELAGTIVQSDAEKAGYRVGDRVTINPNIPCGMCYYCRRGLQTACDNLNITGVHRNGGFARFVTVPAQAVEYGCVFHIPENVTFEEAALIDPASCAVNAAELSGVKPGDTVVVIGAGPAGCLNVEVCRAFGASKIVLLQRSPQRLKGAAFTGADVYVNSSQEDPLERVLTETEGRGADVVIVACASRDAQENGVRMAAKRGNVNFFGGLPRSDAESPFIRFDSNLVHYRESSVTGTHGGSNRHCRIALDMIASGRIQARKYISFRFDLSRFLEALKTAEDKKGLKVFVNPDSQ
jgi:L-iditol 2-dehydrogenase